MPALGPAEMMEVTAFHCAAGLLGSGHALLTRPALRAPPRTATRAAILSCPEAASGFPAKLFESARPEASLCCPS